MVSFSLFSYAQNIGDYIDVVYLKNGSKIKGVIIEQVPNQSVKIKTADGSEFVYAINEVEKFTREEVSTSQNSKKRMGFCDINKSDSLSFMNNYKVQENGYFFLAEGILNSSGNGARITNGYRFGRFGNIGVAIGLESINVNNPGINFGMLPMDYGRQDPVPVASLNLVYSGEMLKKRITPFYQIEAGYGFSVDRYGYNSEKFKPSPRWGSDDMYYGYSGRETTLNYGGPMGGMALGIKFHTNRKVNFKLSLDAKITSNFSDHHSEAYVDTEFGYSQPHTFYQEFNVKPGIGARLGIGF